MVNTIAFFNSVSSWGGGEKWHFDSAVYFKEAGYKVHFFLMKRSQLHKRLMNHPDIQLHFIRVGGLSFLNPVKFRRLKRIFQRFKIEVLFINLSSDLKLAARAGAKAFIPRIIYTRGVAYPIKNSALNRFLFSHWVTDVLASSRATAAAVLQNNPDLIPDNKLQVIYNPIDVKEFSARGFKAVYLRKGNEIVIGSLGRLEKEKNHAFLIDLSENLAKKGIEHTFLIGGTGSLEDSLKERIASKGLKNHFIFTGFLENVKDLLMCCDIFILPSLKEGFGFVLAEASLCKKPIIAFNTSSIPELVIDKETGFIVEINHVEACAEKVIFLKNHPEVIQKMGEKGCSYVENTFNKPGIMAQLEGFVNEPVAR